MLNRSTQSAQQQWQNLVNGVCTNYITQKPQLHGNSPVSNANLRCFELYLSYFRHLEEHYVTIPGFENTWWELEPLWIQERKWEVQGCPALRSFTKMLFSISLYANKPKHFRRAGTGKRQRQTYPNLGFWDDGWLHLKKKKKKNVIYSYKHFKDI